MSPRKYELKARAATQAETRQRIIEAVFALHSEIGPGQTTISAIAERAGVERLTVYRHFPEEAELFAACSAHFRAACPPPDPARWAAIANPEQRLERALLAFYDYYDRAEAMIANVVRDAPQMPALAPFAERRLAFARVVRDALVAAWPVRGAARRRLRAVVGHALQFEIWRSLVRGERLRANEAVALMVALAHTAARRR